MEVTLTNVENIFRPQARGGLPMSYSIGTIQVIANNQDEIWNMVREMQSWANGTFQPVIIERPDPDGPLIVSPKKTDIDLNIDLDPITGMPM